MDWNLEGMYVKGMYLEKYPCRGLVVTRNLHIGNFDFTVLSDVEPVDIESWCNENFGPKWSIKNFQGKWAVFWTGGGEDFKYRYHFAEKNHAVLFLLRYGK